MMQGTVLLLLFNLLVGTYRVQLGYGSSIADRDKGDWLGGFRSPVFEIRISR